MWNCQKLVQKYGNQYILYQHLGDGSATGESLEMWNGVLLSEATKTMRFCTGNTNTPPPSIQQGIHPPARPVNVNASTRATTPTPLYFNTRSKSTSAQALREDLRTAGLHDRTPVYIEANTADPTSSHILNHLLADQVLRMPPLPDGLAPSNVQSFMYIGGQFSGTYMHQHGSTCLHSDGPKIWFLFNKTGMCALRGPPAVPRYLPQRCPARSSMECIENMHPLEILQHYEELQQLGLAPFVHLQQAGEVFCFPERWFHAVVNVGDSVGTAFVLDRVDSLWHSAEYCQDDKKKKTDYQSRKGIEEIQEEVEVEDGMEVEEEELTEEELTEEELKVWISASGDYELEQDMESGELLVDQTTLSYTEYMSSGLKKLRAYRVDEAIAFFNQAVEVAEPDSEQVCRAHLTLARTFADALSRQKGLCAELRNATSSQYRMHTKGMFHAQQASKGLSDDAELNMILADLHIALGQLPAALLHVGKAVDAWIESYEGDMFAYYPGYLNDPTWALGTVSMAVSLARRTGNQELASTWFWKAKDISQLFQWQYPSQTPGNPRWLPESTRVVEFPGWLEMSSLDSNPASAWIRELKEMCQGNDAGVRAELTALLAQNPPSQWLPLRSHRPDSCSEPSGSKELELWSSGHWNQQVCQYMPAVCAFLRQHAAIVGTNKGRGLVGQVSVMYIVPGLHRGPTFDNTGERMVAHFGLDTATSVGSHLTIRVGNATKTEGEDGGERVLAYDSSFEHEIWNKGRTPWIGLHIPFFHPRYAKFLSLVVD